MGADGVAKWLHDQNVSPEDFHRRTKHWMDLALKAIKTENGEVPEKPPEQTNESLSIKGWFLKEIGMPINPWDYSPEIDDQPLTPQDQVELDTLERVRKSGEESQKRQIPKK